MRHGIEWVSDRARLDALADRWGELTHRDPTPFGDHAWFKAWWDAFGAGRALRICVLWRENDLCAALPLSARRARLASLANYHTPMFSVPAIDRAALESLAEAALREQPSELTIHALAATDALLDAIARASRRQHRTLLVEDLSRSPFVRLEGDFQSYVKSRGRRFKDVVRRWRKVNREHEVAFRFEDSIADLDSELRRGFEVEASGWKGRNRTAILSTGETTAFYTALAHAYHGRGELRLAWLDIDGEPAAFNFCLLRRGRLFSLKTGYDERFRGYSPGILIDYCAIERCFELGVRVYELLGAEERYKAYYATASTERVRARSYRHRPIPLARYLGRCYALPVAGPLVSRIRR